MLPPPVVLAFPLLEQPSTTQASLLPQEVAEGKEVDQGVPQPEDKGKGKEAKAQLEAKGKEAAFVIKDADSKAKDAAAKAKDDVAKAKEAESKVKDVVAKDDPPYAKA